MAKTPHFSSEHVHCVVNPNKYGQPHMITDMAECIETIAAIIDDLLLTDYGWRVERIAGVCAQSYRHILKILRKSQI